MSSAKNIIKLLVVFGLIIGFLFGLLLVFDEITMVFPFLADMGVKDRFLGDLSAYHIEGLHHWQFGVFLMILMILCGVGLYIYFKKD